MGDYHLIILDEPTNYLDLVTMEALENFLKDYIGSYILISHDEEFVQNLGTTIWRIDSQQLKLPHQQVVKTSLASRELEVLQLRKNQMIADETVSLEELQKLIKQIQELETQLNKQ